MIVSVRCSSEIIVPISSLAFRVRKELATVDDELVKIKVI
jgi:hypothetical protein